MQNFCACLPCVEKPQVDESIIEYEFKNMTDEQKRYRIKYLWFKIRCVYNMIRFLAILKNNQKEQEDERESQFTTEIMEEEDEV